jgi:hypothetical protein
MSGGWETSHARTHLEESLCREGVCEREERLSLRIDFFPEVERDVVGLLVSAHGPDLLGFKNNEHPHITCSVVGLLTPMNHSLQKTIVSATCEGDRISKPNAYCAMVPEGLMLCFRARCTCIAGSAAKRQANRGATDVARSKKLPPSRVILLCAYQLADYKVMRMVRTPATRAEFAERAARLEQLGALLIRTVCILDAHQRSIILTYKHPCRWTHLPGPHSPSLCRQWKNRSRLELPKGALPRISLPPMDRTPQSRCGPRHCRGRVARRTPGPEMA